MDAEDPGPASDEALLARLGSLMRQADPMPAHLTAAARGLYGLRRLEAELAQLAYDSAVDEPELAVRAEGGPRLLTFESAGLRLELQVEQADDGARLFGQLGPRGAARIQLRDSSGRVLAEADADDAGRFELDRIPRGAVQVICRRGDARPVSTDWTTLA